MWLARRGVSAEQRQNHRDVVKQRYREERRKTAPSEEDWIPVVNKSRQHKKYSPITAKPYNTRPITLQKRYAMLEEAHSISDDETHYRPTIPQIQSGYATDNGMYKSMYNRYEERDVKCRPHRGGKDRRGRQDTSRSQSRARSRGRHEERERKPRSSGRREEREKMPEWKERERECSPARKTYTHTRHTDNYTTKTLAPHATNSRDEQTLRPHDTHTEFDRTDLDSKYSTYTTRLDLGNPENVQLANRYSYRTESRMEVNDVTAERTDEQPPLTTGLTYIPAQRAGDVVPKTSVQGNTHSNNVQVFSQKFLNLLAGAPKVRSNEFQSSVEQLNVKSHESVIENRFETASISSLCAEQSFEIANDVSRLGQESFENINELDRVEQDSGLELKNRLHYYKTEELPLPEPLGTDRHGRLTTGKPPGSVSPHEAGNDDTASGHIIPLSVKIHHKQTGKDMVQCPAVHNQFFRDRT